MADKIRNDGPPIASTASSSGPTALSGAEKRALGQSVLAGRFHAKLPDGSQLPAAGLKGEVLATVNRLLESTQQAPPTPPSGPIA